MTLLDDLRSAGLDARLTDDGSVQLRGPADVKGRLAGALRRRRVELVRLLRHEGNPCCERWGRTGGCDHVWCETCRAWANDTGTGPSCHPRHNGQIGCPCENCTPRRREVPR